MNEEFQNPIERKSKKGFAIKTKVTIGIVMVWNFFILLDFIYPTTTHPNGSHIGLGAQLATAFMMTFCLILLMNKPAQERILKEDRSFQEIKRTIWIILIFSSFFFTILTVLAYNRY